MNWLDIASIVFVSVTANHLGLIGEMEHIYGHRIKVLNCPKCLSFWLTAIYGLWGTGPSYGEFARLFAISFLASYSSIWLELIEALIDNIYNKIYDKIYPTENNAAG